MREMEFLPAWYPMLRKRRRIFAMQIWIGVAALSCGFAWLMYSSHTVQAAEASLAELRQQRADAETEVKKFRDTQDATLQLSERARLIIRLGPRISTGRILRLLQNALPETVAITDLSVHSAGPENESRPAEDQQDSAATEIRANIHGVAPEDSAIEQMVSTLAATPQFHKVTLDYLRQGTRDGWKVREFSISLTLQGVAGQSTTEPASWPR